MTIPDGKSDMYRVMHQLHCSGYKQEQTLITLTTATAKLHVTKSPTCHKTYTHIFDAYLKYKSRTVNATI